MGENSKIEWTHHTFNAWRGCTKVSSGCANCYADAQAKRNPGVLGVWGPNGSRVVAAESMWREPLKWDAAAKAAGERHRVFCASMADVFEDWRGPMVDASGDRLWVARSRAADEAPWWLAETPQGDWSGMRPATMDDVRERLLFVIRDTPNLDWLLLTKRPENIGPTYARLELHEAEQLPNIWLGTSVENQAAAEERVPKLLDAPARVRFLSCEPLLGPVDLSRALALRKCERCHAVGPDGLVCSSCNRTGFAFPSIDWVIVGGESGPSARPMHDDWARSLRDQCQAAGVPFHFKQRGEWFPSSEYDFDTGLPRLTGKPEIYLGPQGDVSPCASTFEHGCPCNAPRGHVSMVRVGKAAAGRLLEGREWNEFPQVTEARS